MEHLQSRLHSSNVASTSTSSSTSVNISPNDTTSSSNRFNLDRDFENTLNVALQNIDANPFLDHSRQSSTVVNSISANHSKFRIDDNDNDIDNETDSDTNEAYSLHGLNYKARNMSSSYRNDQTSSLLGDVEAARDGRRLRSAAGTSGLLFSLKDFLGIPPGSSRSKSSIQISHPHSSRPSSVHLPENCNDLPSPLKDRIINPHMDAELLPTNAISNAKYNALTFLPMTLYEQFKFFFNLYFLLVALSQAIPALRIGYLSSYVVPLAFVLTVTLFKEASDDIQRRRRDNEQNSELYEVLGSARPVRSKDLRCGDLVKLYKDVRVPADMVLVQSSESSGESFVKTDQLDGETDWKLRVACPLTQSISEEDLNSIQITAEPPSRHIHDFLGKMIYGINAVGLTVDNTAWANTVLASGSAIGCIVYTGRDTRQAMNTSAPRAKTGLLESEINRISKILCICVFILSVALVAANGFGKDWYLDIMRFLILFSTIIPVSLRVNLDLGKSVYAHQIEHDRQIPDTIVRTSTIPEDLGRIEYLLTDKTGTLTQNDMELKKLHLGSISYAGDTMDLVAECVKQMGETAPTKAKKRRDMGARVRDLVVTLAVCHNVTPTYEGGKVEYQASSPDEIAIVNFTKSVGLSLTKRDRHSITLLHAYTGRQYHYDILQMFPFNSDTKRMGIIVHDTARDEYWFLEKGADTVMSRIVQQNDWLEEETSNMASEGLRTLVVGRKKLTKTVYDEFHEKFESASASMIDRDQQMARVVTQYLEHDLELQGLTGVEDKLQENVKSSIESLRNAGIKIWMLTGDKVETARCVAVSAKLISRGQYVHVVTQLSKITSSTSAAHDVAIQQLEYLKSNPDACLLIDGESLGIYMRFYRDKFCKVVIRLPAVIACRCTPQQKADVATMIKEATNKRVCCIGDGGNDVSMIQSANVGVGIVGKEGKQASLAADFSVTQFSYLTKLLMWHGRNSYKRSAKLAQFVIHRGLLISVCQAVFSICSSFAPLALYQGWLMVGYATLYTMAPVFSLVLDYDVSEDLVTLYPELYEELTEGKSLSFKTFFVWVAVSFYQGIVMQGLSQLFVGLDEVLFTSMVAISYTALIINELIMVAFEVHTWNKTMVWTELVTLGLYIGSVPFLSDYFDLSYVASASFVWQSITILAISLVPIWAAKALSRKLRPPNYAKVQQAA
ncbi:Putative aminophospholipid-translocase [Brettanomyces nanus]|uniref:Phospholipid-transporting ATPase n=1 Tax=Eeniella nana TaxID=13502 RepID=A0A875S3R0_EENNA|nr:Putative aminophospholipid-translocase [Brettanomyces nanus]QPG75533.1 Putative aminophospholipid-translocase [Brettanomyces nanus]